MNTHIIRNQLTTHPLFKVLIGWVVFFLFYSILKNAPKTEFYSACFSLIGESSLDAVAAFLTFKLWVKFEDSKHRIVFLCLTISFVALLIADLVYNLVLNLFNFKYQNTLVMALFDIPFALFLSTQLFVWGYIISFNGKIGNNKIAFFTPNIILSVLLYIMFTFGIPWKINYFSIVGLFQSLDTFLEVSGFALATICLARAKSQLLRYLTIGYLIVVSSDFIIRYYVVSDSIPYLSPFESTWILGLLIICKGCYLSFNEKNDQLFRLLPPNSLQSQITILSLILWLASVFLFIGSNYFFLEHKRYFEIKPDFLSILVPFSVISIICSNYLSTKISSTFSKVENIISDFIEADYLSISDLKTQVKVLSSANTNKEKKSNNFEIYEVTKMHKFIMNSIIELQEVNRIKAEFLMNMSHDFRTPASGIYHMSRSVYRRITDPESKKLQQLIVDSSEQLMNFLDDVLDYSRLNSNKYELEVKTFNIKTIIEDVISFVSAKLKEKNLTINCQYDNLPINYLGDRSIIQRIILNIVSNAIKFTHAGGVTISANVETFEKKEWVRIRIIDTGIGIDETNHKLIFEPFSRVASSETSKYPGIGLGLSNVILMLKKIGGEIILESSLSKGATFTLFLPT